jgi:hypothetical protein
VLRPLVSQRRRLQTRLSGRNNAPAAELASRVPRLNACYLTCVLGRPDLVVTRAALTCVSAGLTGRFRELLDLVRRSLEPRLQADEGGGFPTCSHVDPLLILGDPRIGPPYAPRYFPWTTVLYAPRRGLTSARRNLTPNS